jgi:hypothetical protein
MQKLKCDSKEELPPAGFHLMPVVRDNPLKVPELGVKGAFLKRPQFQGKPWTQVS